MTSTVGEAIVAGRRLETASKHGEAALLQVTDLLGRLTAAVDVVGNAEREIKAVVVVLRQLNS